MKIIERNGKYELIVYEDAFFQDYENVLKFLMQEMPLKDIDEINDFDTHYQLFNYNGYVIVLYYNNSLGISIYFDDKTIDNSVQLQVLNEFLKVLEKRRP